MNNLSMIGFEMDPLDPEDRSVLDNIVSDPLQEGEIWILMDGAVFRGNMSTGKFLEQVYSSGYSWVTCQEMEQAFLDQTLVIHRINRAS